MICALCHHDCVDDAEICPQCASPLLPSTLEQQAPGGTAGAKSGRPGQRYQRTRTPTPERFAPGTLLTERYRIVNVLGRGGMGHVYRAEDLTLGGDVALKFLPEELEQDRHKLEMLLAEVRVARRVSHPNVCRMHDVAVHALEPGKPLHFLTMEYIAGEDLASLLRRTGRLPKAKALEISLELCAGLAAVHGRGLLHRDIKPANVMIDRAGHVRLTDFGLAITRHERAIHGGTPAYMAPEQHTAPISTVRSDIYSLGLVLYRIFTGTPAFEARSPREYARLHTEEAPPPPSSHHRGLDPAIERIILGCLRKDPEQRITPVVAIAQALAEIDPGGPTVRHPGLPLATSVAGLRGLASAAPGQPPPGPVWPRAAIDTPTVLLYAHAKDQPLVAGVRRFLWERGLRTEELGNDPLQPVGLRHQALERAAALLIFHGEVAGRWVEARLMEAVKIVTAERRSFVFSVFLGSPADKNLAPYDAFRFYKFHLLDHRSGFRGEAFGPLLASLGHDGAVADHLPDCPFIGLRSFGFTESSLFHGRDSQVQDLLEQLHRTRFVAVLGNSGCGKSSLLRAGLIPALEAGWLVADRDRWRIAPLRPGSRPVESLLAALRTVLEDEPSLDSPTALVRRLMQEGAGPLFDLLAPTLEQEQANLLLLVDQFEETFRFGLRGDAGHRREAEALVSLLLDLARSASPIYVMLTMRSDFLGDCDAIEGLPEALNRNQYLVPRLGRERRREAIEGPVRLYGRRIDARLADRLLDDVGEASDQLPLMQHALMRIWERAEAEEVLGLEHYVGVGTLAGALSKHADEALVDLAEDDRRLAEWVFRALTEIDPEGRRIRRPRTIAQLEVETDGDRPAIERVIQAFRRSDRAFLMPPEPLALAPETLIDISHESLIRQWNRLRHWVDSEGEAAAIYRKLVARATAFADDGRNPLVDRELEEAVAWARQTRPGQGWLARYGGDPGGVSEFIAESQRLDERRRREEARRAAELEEAREREASALRSRARQAKRLNQVFAAAVLVALVLASVAMLQSRKAQMESEEAQRQNREARYNLSRMFDERAATAVTAARSLGRSEDYDKAWLYTLAALREPAAEGRLPTAVGKLLALDVRDSVFREVWRSPTVLGQVFTVSFSHDGRHLVSGDGLGTVRLWEVGNGRSFAILGAHSNWVYSIALSPDGRRLASSGADGALRLWALETSQEGHTLKGHTKSVTSIAFSPDGHTLASSSYDRTIRLWDLETAQSAATLEGHSETVYSVAFSPDGRRLASGSSDRTIRLWNPETGQSLATLKGHSKSVRSVAFSPDGRRLASGSLDRAIRLWDLETLQSIVTIEGHTGPVLSIAFSPDGHYVASGSLDRAVRLWDTQTGRSITALEGHAAAVWSVAFSRDGRHVASASSDQTIRLWDIQTGQTIATNEEHSEPVYSVALGRDGQLLASSSHDRTIRLWDLDTGTSLATLIGHEASVWSVALAPDGLHLASGSSDQTIRLWNLDTAQSIATLEGHIDTISAVAYSPDGHRLASASFDRTIRLWDLDTGQSVTTLEGHGATVWSVAFSPDGRHLASGSYDRTLKLWDLETANNIATLEGHTDTVSTVAFSPCGLSIASGSHDGTIRLWDLDTGHEIATFEDHSDMVSSLAFSPDGRRLASGGFDRTLRLWDIKTGLNLATITGHSNAVSSVAFDPEGRRLASGSYDRTLRLWNLETGHNAITLEGSAEKGFPSFELTLAGHRFAAGASDRAILLWDLETGRALDTLQGHETMVSALGFSRDGRYLASGSEDGAVRLWDLKTTQSIATLEGHSSWIWKVVFSPDGRRLASASSDQTIRLWDLETAENLTSLEGHEEPVWGLAFSPDGSRLASGSQDRTIRLWDLETRICLDTLEGHTDRVFSVEFSPGGKRLASASDDRTIRLWNPETAQEIATLEGHSNLVSSVVFSPDGRYLASGSSDRTTRLWDLQTHQSIATLEKHSSSPASIAFSPDDLVSISFDQTVRHWTGSIPEALLTGKANTPLFDGAYRASLRVLGYRSDGLDFESVPRPVHLSPINGYRFPKPFEVPAVDRPRPAGKDVLEWLLEVGEELPDEAR